MNSLRRSLTLRIREEEDLEYKLGAAKIEYSKLELSVQQ